MSNEISINKTAVAKAVRAPLKAYYKAASTHGDDSSDESAEDWESNEELAKALEKSPYVSKHLDWDYVLALIDDVLRSNSQLTPAAFAEELEKTIVATASQRDYLAIFPLSFSPALTFYFAGVRKRTFRRRVVGQFTISPAASSLKALNKIAKQHGFPATDESSFQHAMKTSGGALSRQMIVTFNVHGAVSQLRHNAQIEFRTFHRLVEVFGCLFGGRASGIGTSTPVQHFFLLRKTKGELLRLPTRAPSTIGLPLTDDLLHALARPVFKNFLSKLSSARDTMYGRMKNAIKFFSMGLNAGDNVARFLFYVVAMESIFSRDKNNPIKSTLADLGAMLCFPPSQRLQAYDRIRKAYDLRSGIVHSGVSAVGRKDVQIAQELAARSIYASLFLCEQLESDQGKLEDRFFNFLRDQKLGLVKPKPPRELWALDCVNDASDEI